MHSNRKSWLSFLGTLFFILGIITLIISGILILGHIINSVKSNNSKADGFYIDSYEVNLDVDSSNKIHVTENITVDFYESDHHGIFRFIPEWLKYKSKDGKTNSRRAEISNIDVEGVAHSSDLMYASYFNQRGLDDFTVDTIHGKQRIKIGNSYYTLEKGLYTYQISYDYDMNGDIYKGFDELIFHAFGDYWGTEINGARVNIKLPKDIDASTVISFFADKKRKNDITSYVNYKVDGNIITAQVSEDYKLNGALTVDIELPDGYFTDSKVTYGSKAFIFSIVCFACFLGCFFFWNKNRDRDLLGEETTVATAPNGLEAVEMGYIYGGSGQLLLITVILQLATKGYIRIKNPSSKTKLKIEKTPKVADNLSYTEKFVYENLFKKGDSVIPAEDSQVGKLNSKLTKMLEEKFDSSIYNLNSYVEYVFSSILFFVACISFCMGYIFSEDMHPILRWLFLPAFVCTIISGYFAVKTPKNSSYGNQMHQRIEDYKNYLSAIKKQELEKEIKENPDYFDEILPYAFILGVSKKLVKKYDFEVDATNRYYNYTDNITTNVYYDYSSSNSGSSSSSSGCGGGCSSCGGGCSSCGGGGSW